MQTMVRAMPVRSAALVLALVAAALAPVAGCQKQLRMGVPAGLAADDAKRLAQAVEIAAKADRERDPDRAADGYREAVTTYREFPSAWNNLGLVLMKQEKYLQAAEAFSTSAELDTSDPRPVYNLALLWDRRGYVREARDLYAKSILRDDSFLPALRGGIRADSLLNEGSLQTLDWLKRALMLEEEEKWLKWMRLQKARIESLPAVRYQSEL